MTITEFMDLFKLRNEDTVISWINKGYIPGTRKDAKTGAFIIPELARPPYTKARAKTSNSIYKSIVKACINRYGVCAKLYGLTDTEFQVYIQDLHNAGYIHIETRDNIDYYFATSKSNEFLNSSKPQELFKDCVESITKGITTACLEKAMA